MGYTRGYCDPGVPRSVLGDCGVVYVYQYM